ncbi:ATP synthase subunit I [Salicibibacter kimchii]|uniref:ATP synthase subunit I n=1 Tax=Salicibibacter kimchii TaxID=2099786 RepID=A0A345BZK1_9BACI|nr:ATP synthase subunit I [Salicibibacter kimchii]AXF56382.1 hypothetical protein DT065_10375 [Salicibibacter kimchii]
MPLLRHRIKHYYWTVAIVYLISVAALFLTAYHSVIFSILIGIAACLFSFTTIYLKALVIDRITTRKSPGIASYLVTVFGLVIRYGLIVMIVAIALTFPDMFHLIAILAGYAVLYIYVMVDMFLQLQKER